LLGAANAFVLVATVGLAACGTTPAARTEPPPAGSSVSPADLEQAREPRYVRYRPEETALVGVFDDGRDTYLEFAHPVARTLSLHDHDGRPLRYVASGVVVATAGLHAGVLVRVGEAASFASPNPRRRHDLAQPFPDRPDFIDARARLQHGGHLQAAMERALTGASPGTVAAGSGVGAGAAAGPGAYGGPVQSPATGSGTAASAGAPVAAGATIGGGLAPLTAANLMAMQPEQGLVRIYFASASRAIVAPDDGLAALLREAPRADRIRVTGYTDAIGSRASNLVLARLRADVVAQILIRRGIDPARIEIAAVAADDYIADNDTDRGRALNRRAEVLLLRDGRPLKLGALRPRRSPGDAQRAARSGPPLVAAARAVARAAAAARGVAG
jgi:hypothetical protein